MVKVRVMGLIVWCIIKCNPFHTIEVRCLLY